MHRKCTSCSPRWSRFAFQKCKAALTRDIVSKFLSKEHVYYDQRALSEAGSISWSDHKYRVDQKMHLTFLYTKFYLNIYFWLAYLQSANCTTKFIQKNIIFVHLIPDKRKVFIRFKILKIDYPAISIKFNYQDYRMIILWIVIGWSCGRFFVNFVYFSFGRRRIWFLKMIPSQYSIP